MFSIHMKKIIQSLINYYNLSPTFHSFVICLEYAAVSFVTSYSGGVPTSKSGWIALGGAFVGTVIGAAKRWVATNIATVRVPQKN